MKFEKDNIKFKSIFKNLVLFFFSVYLSLVLVSFLIYLKHLYPKFVYQDPQVIKYCEKNEKNCQKKNLKYFFVEEKKKDKDLAIYAPPIHSQKINNFAKNNIFPLSGVSNSRTLICSEIGKYIFISSDRYGFNNDDNMWDKKDIDIALVGDSYAFGECVNSEDNITSNLIKTKYSALSLGYGSNGPLAYLASIREYVKFIKPKKVIWVFCTNDLEDLSREKNIEILTNYLNPNFNQNLIQKQKFIDQTYYDYYDFQFEKLNREWPYKFSITRLFKLEPIKILYNNFLTKIDKKKQINIIEKKYNYNLFSKILSQAKLEIEAWGGELIFLYLPGAHAFDGNNLKSISFTSENRLDVINTVKELNIKFVDIEKKLLDLNIEVNQIYSLGMGHFTELGYKIVSNELIYFLKN